jgi:type VI secretion system protein ImpF
VQQRFAPFLLDRLMDHSSGAGPADASRLTRSLEQLKDSVARDVEALLNSRSAMSEAELSDYKEAKRSLLRFGLDDFSSRTLASVDDRAHICQSIQRAIADHETRLRNTVVEIEVDNTRGGGAVRFLIRGLLVLHPTAEPVSFDAVMRTGSKHYEVQKSPLRRSA